MQQAEAFFSLLQIFQPCCYRTDIPFHLQIHIYDYFKIHFQQWNYQVIAYAFLNASDTCSQNCLLQGLYHFLFHQESKREEGPISTSHQTMAQEIVECQQGLQLDLQSSADWEINFQAECLVFDPDLWLHIVFTTCFWSVGCILNPCY